jgi:hypothetical protein
VAAKFQALAVIPRLQALFFLSGFSGYAIAGNMRDRLNVQTENALDLFSIVRRSAIGVRRGLSGLKPIFSDLICDDPRPSASSAFY